MERVGTAFDRVSEPRAGPRRRPPCRARARPAAPAPTPAGPPADSTLRCRRRCQVNVGGTLVLYSPRCARRVLRIMMAARDGRGYPRACRLVAANGGRSDRTSAGRAGARPCLAPLADAGRTPGRRPRADTVRCVLAAARIPDPGRPRLGRGLGGAGRRHPVADPRHAGGQRRRPGRRRRPSAACRPRGHAPGGAHDHRAGRRARPGRPRAARGAPDRAPAARARLVQAADDLAGTREGRARGRTGARFRDQSADRRAADRSAQAPGRAAEGEAAAVAARRGSC